MSVPGFSAQAALYKVSRVYRAASGNYSGRAGVQPAELRVSFHCTEPGSDYNRSCTSGCG
jgi:hypothetical protein